MTTFARVQKLAKDCNYPLSTFIDAATPDGHFVALTKIKGNVVTYLLEGELDDPDAVLKGHIVIIERADSIDTLGYRGRGLASGNYMGHIESYEDAFTKMV